MGRTIEPWTATALKTELSERKQLSSKLDRQKGNHSYIAHKNTKILKYDDQTTLVSFKLK